MPYQTSAIAAAAIALGFAAVNAWAVWQGERWYPIGFPIAGALAGFALSILILKDAPPRPKPIQWICVGLGAAAGFLTNWLTTGGILGVRFGF